MSQPSTAHFGHFAYDTPKSQFLKQVRVGCRSRTGSCRGKASFPAQRVAPGILHRFDLSFCLRPCALSYQVYKKEENAAVECEAKYGNGLDKEAAMPAGAGATVPKAPARDFR